MTMRTKSRSQQWTVWFSSAVAALLLYVLLSRWLIGAVGWNLLDPRQHRLVLPILVVFLYIVKETRWDGIKREKERVGGGEKSGGEAKDQGAPSSHAIEVSPPPCDAQPVARQSPPPPLLSTSSSQLPFASSVSSQSEVASGEDLYAQARSIQHRKIPDFKHDADYLDLLGRSAAKGYVPALMKLGEYAMRRAAWVEAYYWMKQAERQGMRDGDVILRKIRKHWSQDGFCRQSANVNNIFTEEAGRLGRALLRLDSGYEAAKAKAFLKANYPEYLD